MSKKNSIKMIVCIYIFCISYAYGNSVDVKSNEILSEHNQVLKKYKDKPNSVDVKACYEWPDYGDIKIQSVPSGAKIYIDGELQEDGYGTFRVSIGQQHTIIIKHPEHEEFCTTITISTKKGDTIEYNSPRKS